jgi:hypothetical protein
MYLILIANKQNKQNLEDGGDTFLRNVGSYKNHTATVSIVTAVETYSDNRVPHVPRFVYDHEQNFKKQEWSS